MKLTEQIKATPIQMAMSDRPDNIRAITSAMPGVITPLYYAPILREDRISQGSLSINVTMMETAEPLMNAINVEAEVHFIPFLAFERFGTDLGRFNRSYMGKPDYDGGAVIPFFETIPFTLADEITHKLGVHAVVNDPINSAVHEAYSTLINYKRKGRTSKLPVFTKNSTTLAQAFWKNNGAMGYIVPDFEAAAIDAEVPLTMVNGQLPVSGLGTSLTPSFTSKSLRETSGTGGTTGNYELNVQALEDTANPGFPAIFAEMQAGGLTLSLANIEQAKKMASFANLRKQYSGLDDDHIMDLLMQAIRVPDAQMGQPILLDRQSTIVGYNQRHASDGANLDKSVTTGETGLRLTFRTPAMNTGGILLVTCSIVPEQLFERQRDAFMDLSTVAELPNALRDELDPEKVSIVPSKMVDVLHSTPDLTFGYAPLNYEWRRDNARVGGKFRRQIGDPVIEDRQRIWSSEVTDPSLTEDFYLVNGMTTDVFADTISDPFEITTLGGMQIVGTTVFGKGLEEDTGDVAAIDAIVDDTRIDQTA